MEGNEKKAQEIAEAIKSLNPRDCIFTVYLGPGSSWSMLIGKPEEIASAISMALNTEMMRGNQTFVFNCAEEIVEHLNGSYGLGWRKDE